MLIALAAAAALDVTPPSAAPAGSCADAAIADAFKSAVAVLKTDPAAAKAALVPAAACPVRSGPTFAAHVLRADLAVHDGDWTTARAMLAGVGVHPEASLSNLAGFLRLRADQGAGDRAAFTHDRADLIAADGAALSHLGRKVESFRAGASRVDAYEAPVVQGAFARRYEFIAVPDDPAAYPSSVLVTDDLNAVAMGKQMAKAGEAPPEHVWFFDLYTCDRHATLAPPAQPLGPGPTYAEARAAASTALGGSGGAPVPPPPRAACSSYLWLLPGLGAHAPAG